MTRDWMLRHTAGIESLQMENDRIIIEEVHETATIATQ